ncbi:hypothetical protein LXT12_13115 [Pelomonas sp. P7]|uniref:Uncharacterized protein n=1 Tax=Pelomonas caseinilytica TaxID=2906763 RepID=A0ABS8XFD4_9BURK|nr:hypothetical protein [Pelomonas sp. P7]MCE4538192.1 hypothetical protein [Pelomonas sp. P7]
MAIQLPTVLSHARFAPVSDWLSRPLCCRYAFAEFKVLNLPIRHSDTVEQARWLWAVGLFEQDQYEILGAWSDQTPLAEVAHDLHKRGIEQITAIAAERVADFASLHPTVQWSAAADGVNALRLRTGADSGRQRRVVLQSAATTAERLHKSITRAIRRRAPFEDEVAAAAFLAQALEKADRRLYAT